MRTQLALEDTDRDNPCRAVIAERDAAYEILNEIAQGYVTNNRASTLAAEFLRSVDANEGP